MKQEVIDIANKFREVRHQSLVSAAEKKPPKEKKSREDRYSSFLKKYLDLENTVDTFNSMDLLYFFREKAKESGGKYVIANLPKDLSIFKKLQENYTPREICLMIEFLFSKEQDYIETPSPNVLASRWCNTVYSDSLKWAKDEYVPKKKNAPREWKNKVAEIKISETKADIGEWE